MAWTTAALALAAGLLGCAQSHDVDAEHGLTGPEPGSEFELSTDCRAQIDSALDGLPDDLACTGLYLDVASKDPSPAMREFAPAIPLWSDGSGKQRWIYLPPGKKIDASAPDAWVFPLGTRLFKEFSVDGRRIETRLYQKARADRWVRATYVWDDEETAALRSNGGDRVDIQIGGATYHVPSGSECDQCHEGRRERILGFEMISLGQEKATGVTLATLIEEDLISPVPEQQEITIGDDGTGYASEALGWLHINCGVSCHNDNQNSEAYTSGLRLKLESKLLDGRSSADFEILRTTVGVTAKTLRWNNQQRIVPGSPQESLLFQLVSVRMSGKNNQMPPIATRVIPQPQVDVLEQWILAMQPRQPIGGLQ